MYSLKHHVKEDSSYLVETPTSKFLILNHALLPLLSLKPRTATTKPIRQIRSKAIE